jgi:hypothetical protein
MNEFWRRLIEMERRQDRANHMMARSSEQIEQAKVDNYKGGIFSPIQNVGNLQPGYGVIGTYPFGFDGLWIKATFPYFPNESDRWDLPTDYYNTTYWEKIPYYEGFNSDPYAYRDPSWLGFVYAYASNSDYQNPSSYSYPFSTARNNVYVYNRTQGQILGETIINDIRFVYDWKRGQLQLNYNFFRGFFEGYGGATTGGYWRHWVDATCESWIDFNPNDPPFSFNSGSITAPGTCLQWRWLDGLQGDKPQDYGIVPAEFTFRWDSPTDACAFPKPPALPDPNDPDKTIPNPDYKPCIYKHWDEFDWVDGRPNTWPGHNN